MMFRWRQNAVFSTNYAADSQVRRKILFLFKVIYPPLMHFNGGYLYRLTYETHRETNKK